MAMNVDELGEWIAEQAAHLDAATHRLLTAVREYRGWDLVLDRNRELEITAGTPACGWDGQPVDYEWVIDALVSADRAVASS